MDQIARVDNLAKFLLLRILSVFLSGL